MTGRMGKTRNIFLVWLVWPLITFGIYRIVWWYKINREARDLDERIVVSPGLAVLAITLGAFIIVPPFVSVYKTGERIGQILLPEACANLCFGGSKRNLLFMAASQSLYAVYVETRGAHFC